MNLFRNVLPTEKIVTGFAMILLSVLMAAYAPMHLHSTAKAVEASAITQLKDKLSTEINRQIAGLKDTLGSIKVESTSGEGTVTAGIVSNNGGVKGTIACDTAPAKEGSDVTAGLNLGFKGNTLEGSMVLPCSVVDDVKGLIQEGVTGLTGLLEKVKSSLSLENLQKLATEVGEWLKKTIASSVQGMLTSAIGAVTGVIDTLKTTFNSITERVTQVGQCVFGNDWTFGASVNSTDEGPTVGVSASPTAKDGSEETAGGEDCEEMKLSVSGQDVMDGAEKLMQVAQPIIQMALSIVMSVVAMLPSLLSSLTGVMGGGGGGNISGIMTLFTSSLSQLGNVTGMIGNVSGILGGINI